MNKEQYLELPEELRKTIFTQYNKQNSSNNHSPDFNRGQLHILEELFGWENCSSYIENHNNITYEFSGIADKINENNTINFIPDNCSIDDIKVKENELKSLIKNNSYKIKLIINLIKIENE